jgi:diguanylate cyclase (GGDEF)-like protein
MAIPKPLYSLTGWYARQSRVTRDLIVIALVGLPIYLGLVWYEALDRFFELTRAHQNHSLDWLVLLIVCLGIAAKIFSIRRVIDLHREVAERRKAEAEAYQLARLDVLTGLPNRRWFVENFERWAEQRQEDEACALFVVDLDNFKPINDVYGHRLGDEVLKAVARRLTRLAEAGAVARLGGDEFGVIICYPRNSDAPERLARQIVHEISKPIPLAALSLQVGASVGISISVPGVTGNQAMAQRDGPPVQTALRQADMAMYWAKAEGRGRYCFFDRTMDEKLQRRVELEGEIKSAIAGGQIVPYYQPVVDLETSKAVGFEVLARWQHPTRGLLLPSVFIPIAEDTGTIAEMTDYLLARAISDAKQWPSHMFVSINVSPRQISDPGLATRILGLLGKASFPPHRLMIEITENAVVQNLENARSVLRSLRNVGVRVALDDFGTGYSGLYHLRALELDAIKIDRSFVTRMLDNPDESKIVKAIVSLSRSLGLHTTAEGIETVEVLDQLAQFGCDTGQGDLFGAAESASLTTQALQEQAVADECDRTLRHTA